MRCPTEGLALLGIESNEVEDVIITHMHYDHVGNLALFPNARFRVQDSELNCMTGRAMTHKTLRHSFALDDVLDMVRLVCGDRVVFHDGDEPIAPGISVHHVGRHARGLQSVRVNTGRGQVVLASDASHYYENVEQEVMFFTVENIFLMQEGFRELRGLAPSPTHIIPGHEPEVLRRYAPPSPEFEGIVARLDRPPIM